MAQWQRHIDIRDEWNSENVQLIAKTLAEKLRNMTPLDIEQIDSERAELADQFADLANDPSANADEFDCVMQELYDWADTRLDDHWNGRKVCWIATTI